MWTSLFAIGFMVTGRKQVLKVNGSYSNVLTFNTGAPQGCVLSPILLTPFTNYCVSYNPSVTVTKISDDSTFAGLYTNSDEMFLKLRN